MRLPIEIDPSSKVLISGAGGGYDFACGLPIGIALLGLGVEVQFSNYSFTKLHETVNTEWLSDEILVTNALSSIPNNEYYPEVKFSKWLEVNYDREYPIFCFPTLGIKSLSKAYNKLYQDFGFSHIILIDGGVDGIFRGDEYDLGTPSMDSISIIAASLSKIPNKIFAFTAFGTEGINKEVSHAQVLRRVADLSRSGDFLGSTSLTRQSKAGQLFTDAVNFAYQNSRLEHQSVMVSSILRSIYGDYGDTAVNSKTQERKVWVSPLTSMYWFFNLDPVAKMKLFYDDVLESDSVVEVSDRIAEIRDKRSKGKREEIPI